MRIRPNPAQAFAAGGRSGNNRGWGRRGDPIHGEDAWCSSRPGSGCRGQPTGPCSHHPQSVTLRQFILKTHSRCNLACDYCYLYAGPDHGWRGRPRTPGPAVTRRTAERIAEHAAAHGLPDIAVVLHGGEPLLAGADRLAADIA